MADKSTARPARTVSNGALRDDDRAVSQLGRERVLELQRARMLAAMVQVSSERGAANVTVAHVVDRAGVSRRTFYELFRDREDCFLAAFNEGVARASREILLVHDPKAKWAEQMRTGLTSLLCFLDAERGMGQLLIVGSLAAGENALECRQRLLTRLTVLIDQGRKETKAGDRPPPLTAEGILGGVLSILHARLLLGAREKHPTPLLTLTGPLMSMIVLPYLGLTTARKELTRTEPRSSRQPQWAQCDPLRELQMRLTYRTVRVLTAVASIPGASNRQVADGAGITDQGQISKLLARLHGLGLIQNTGGGSPRGAPNRWTLTSKGVEVERALSLETVDEGAR
jgi:AcrR family transcriptional regulator